MYLSDYVIPDQPRSDGEVTSIQQILAELLVQRGLAAPEPREARAPSAPWRSGRELSAAA
ncbi:MAG: hypothetical protein U0836_01250 [Pirellulales bacterium]